MRRKRFNHYADVICKMFVGWRMGEDLEKLSALPDGTIKINLLTGEAEHSVSGALDLNISTEIQAWLEQQGNKEGINISDLESGILEVDINTEKVATNKKKIVMFHFKARSLLKTNEVSYKGELKETHKWHTRIAT